MEEKTGEQDFAEFTTNSYYYEAIDMWKFEGKEYLFLVRNPS